VGGAI